MFLEYMLTVHSADLLKILQDNGTFKNFSVNVDFLNLFEVDPNLGDGVLCNPINTLLKCDKDLLKAQEEVLANNKNDSQRRLSIKKNVHARFFGLPVCPELHRITIPKNKDLECFLKVTGTAIRLTQSKMLEYRRHYKCTKCHFIQLVEGKYEQRYVIKPPMKCGNPEMQCRSNIFTPANEVTRDNCKDYQEMKIQEQVNRLSVGGIPSAIWVTLEDDLVDCCKPGDDVSICGTVLRRWNPLASNKKCEVELVMKANHIEVCNAQKSIAISIAPDVRKDFDEFWSKYEKFPMKGRDVILASVCSKVYGLYMVKLALLLTVITGSSHNLETENLNQTKTLSPSDENKDRSVRGQCHLLLVGDPGTGKSQLLKAGAVLTSRSILTSGSGSTKAGLTCTALREDGEWQLEAGALVLADGGACCIDELAQMREHDRASIHEAMEQQTISVAKAGIICKLNSRCAVIAACNPKGHYDTEQALSVNVSLGTPLLSRFDLIFILLDTQNHKWDKLVSDYILFGKTSDTINLKAWPLEKLQLYLSLIGPSDVTMSPSANNILHAYYVRQRKAENRDPSRTTVRMLDSLVRLSQAHSRLMYHGTVMPMDAITAVCLMDLSMQDCTLSDTSDALHSNFTKYPDFEYLKTAKRLLASFNLYEIWHSELEYYSKLLNISTQKLNSDIDNDNCRHFKLADSLFETSEIKDDAACVVKSSYFRNTSNDKINIEDSPEVVKIGKNKADSKFEFNINQNEDLDSILDISNEFKDVSKRVNHSKHNDTVDGIVDRVLEKENNGSFIVASANAKKSNTEVLLAESLRKHSTLNISKKNYTGVITGKRKRISAKKNTASEDKGSKISNVKKKIKCNDLQDLLDEVNRKPKKNVDNIAKKSGRRGKNNLENKSPIGEVSSPESDIDQREILKNLPSVNDIFHSTMKFNGSDNEDDISLFEYSQDDTTKLVMNTGEQGENKACEDLSINDKQENNLTISEPSISTGNIKNMLDITNPDVLKENKKISPVSDKTMEKLLQFSFTKEKNVKKSHLENNSIVSHEPNASEKLCSSNSFTINNGSPKKLKDLNKDNSQSGSSKNGSSQRSIFENEDDDYGALDL